MDTRSKNPNLPVDNQDIDDDFELDDDSFCGECHMLLEECDCDND